MKIIKTIFAFALAALTLSCSNLLDDSSDSTSFLPPAGDGMAYISVNVTNQERSNRTLIPTIEISDLVLKGGLTGTEEKVLAEASSLDEMESQQIVIQTGEWSFTLTAKVSGKEFTSGAVTKTIESGGENPLSFTLEPLDTRGKLDFTISFRGNDSDLYDLRLSIKKDTDVISSNSFELYSEEKQNYTLQLEEGTYLLTAEFSAKNASTASGTYENSELLNTYQTLVRIKKGITTKASVDNINLNEIYSITYENYDSSAGSGDNAVGRMILKFSRKYKESSNDGKITLPRLTNDNMTFSGWYTSAITSEGAIDKYAALVPLYDASGNPAPADANPTDPLYTQKIKVSDNLSDQTLYAKWLINAGGNVALASDYKFNFKFLQNNDSDTAARGIYPGQAGKFKLSAEVKLGDEVQTIPASDITWTVQLLNGGIVTDKTPSYENGILTIPAITLQDKYTLKVRADYLGIAHDASFDYDVSYAAENAAAWISSFAGAGSYDVKVEGGVGSGENEGLAQVAKAIKALPAEVYINLDAEATSASSEITSYNDGQYFNGCKALKSIRLPSWMEYVIQDLFNGCTSLESISMSESTQYIGKDAFKGCTSLTSITLPKDITGASSGSHIHGIDTGAFAGCTSLADIYYEGTISDWAGVNQGSGWHSGVPVSVIHCIDGDTAINPLAATPLTLEAIEAGAEVTFKNKASGPVTYKVNGGEPQTIEANQDKIITLPAVGDKVQFFGDNATYYISTSNSNSNISCTKECYVYGNIMSLIHSTDFENEKTLTESYTFFQLFMNNSNIKNMNLLLPATTLTDFCYSGMFCGCTKLTSAPELPATSLTKYCYYMMFQSCKFTKAPELPARSLAESCYRQMFYSCINLEEIPALPARSLAELCYFNMFNGCKGLTTAPELPDARLAESCYNCMFEGCINLTRAPELKATTLAESCYGSMFSGCTSLTIAPELPVTTLAESCYSYMFSGCTSLTNAPVLRAETLTKSCYSGMFQNCANLIEAPELPATTLAESCYSAMFQNCANLIEAPELPAETLADHCYSTMFFECTNLIKAPELPAKTLADHCYSTMFFKCTKLNSITCLATDISAEDCTSNWLFQVALTGTFIKANMLGWSKNSASGIPEGWTEVNYGAANNNISSVTSTLSSMTTNGSVNIEGTITADDFTSLKTALDELKTNNSDVLVDLDFSGATFTEIPENAFKDCSNIQTVKLPEGCETIGYQAFSSTQNLETIYLPVSLTSIGNINFSTGGESHSKVTVYYQGTLEQWLGIEMECSPFTYTTANADTKLYVKENGTDKLIEGEITIDGSKVSRVGNGAFYRNRKITKVTITDGVSKIGNDAFAGTNITEITLPSTMESIGQFAFESTKLESITIPEGITKLDTTFRWCNTLTYIYLPYSLKEITSQTFGSLTYLQTVEGNTTGWKKNGSGEEVELTVSYLKSNSSSAFKKN